LEETGGSTKFRWRRGSIRGEQNKNKEITKGGNNKIGMVQGKSEVSERGQSRRAEWDLTDSQDATHYSGQSVQTLK